MRQQELKNLRRLIDGYERKAPEGLLDDIKKEMSRRDVMPIAPGKSHPRMALIWTRRVAAVAAVGLVAWLLTTRQTPDRTPVMASETPRPAESPAASSPSATPSTLPHSAEHLLAASPKGSATFRDATPLTALADEDAATALPEQQEETPVSAQKNEKGTDSEARNHRSEEAERHLTADDPFLPSRSYRDESVSRLSLSAAYTGLSGGGADGLSAEFAMMSDPNPNLSGEPVRVSEMITKAHHKQPVKVGVSVRYRLNDRWSLQTGAAYSYLSADITRSNNVDEYHTDQTLHYVSIPVSAACNLWHNKRLNVYLSAGAEASKLVGGKARETHTTGGQKNSRRTYDIHEKRLQYAVLATGGIEYKTGHQLSIYAEPGLIHYLDNHSSVTNVYKDKPTQLSLSLGLRLSLGQ